MHSCLARGLSPTSEDPEFYGPSTPNATLTGHSNQLVSFQHLNLQGKYELGRIISQFNKTNTKHFTLFSPVQDSLF